MSIADNFDHVADATFVRDYDSGAARRQFNLSVVLIAALALAASALGMLVRFDAAPSASSLSGAASPPHFAGKL